jgi:hypothetical protein
MVAELMVAVLMTLMRSLLAPTSIRRSPPFIVSEFIVSVPIDPSASIAPGRTLPPPLMVTTPTFPVLAPFPLPLSIPPLFTATVPVLLSEPTTTTGP